MTTASDSLIAAALAAVAPPSPTRGPVRIQAVLDEQNLLQAELPRLSRAAVFDWLMAQGHAPPDFGPDQELAGFLYAAGQVGVVFVNASDVLARRRFTAAHELGHALLHRDRMTGGRWIADALDMIHEVDADESQQHEREANRFAAALLMPELLCRARAAELRGRFPAIPDSVLVHRLAADLLVSREALTYRLRALEVIHDTGA